ncbi:hypothetical protein ZWY2020_042072 [Hordeum vulgare]|nr:hypothetical protein ZWY2020_042072 [Hordeum vulgare]
MATRSGYTGEGGSSIMSMVFVHGSVESSEALQHVHDMEGELPEQIIDPKSCGMDTSSVHRCLSMLILASHPICSTSPDRRQTLGRVLDLDYYGIDITSSP